MKSHYTYSFYYIRGLDGKLKINKFRIDGSVHAEDSQNILKEFMSCQAVDSLLEVSFTF